MKTEGITLQFEDSGIKALAKIAAEVNASIENIGARRLYTILEKVFENLSYPAPDQKEKKITINKNFVNTNLDLFENILNSLESVSAEAKSFLKEKVSSEGKVSNQLLEKHQHEGHGYAWFETYRIALRETLNWFKTLKKV